MTQFSAIILIFFSLLSLSFGLKYLVPVLLRNNVSLDVIWGRFFLASVLITVGILLGVAASYLALTAFPETLAAIF